MAITLMFKWILIVIASLCGLVIVTLTLVPLLISTQPMPGWSSGREAGLADSRFIRIPFAGTKDLEIHYLESGREHSATPPTVVLLHGFTFNAFTWNQISPALADYGRVLAYDQIPYGLSAKPLPSDWSGANPYSKEAALTQLWAFLDAQNITQAILVGNSSGGTLALEAALAAPERITGLVLINPWVYVNRPSLPDALTRLPQMYRVSLGLARQMGTRAWLLDLSYHQPERISAERRALTTIHTQISHWDLAWGELFLRALSSPVEISAHLAEIQQPALLIIGAEDRVVKPEDSLRVAAALPQAEVVSLADCGHVPQEECPTEVSAALRHWLPTVLLLPSPERDQ